ncbi:MAG: hypothetical protein O7F71_06815 [Gammaproteobacteria bacterium]|nr:hypothetical protein [Gammaproteobacteria bacterium]
MTPMIREQKVVEQSDLLPMLFDGLDTAKGLTVFDVGPAVPETVDFFAQFKCRLFFADLLPDLPTDKSPEEGNANFGELLTYPPETRFDICLFWDFLNFLDIKMLRAFNFALTPHIHDNTRAHCYGRFSRRSPAMNQQFGIRKIDEVVVRNSHASLPTYYPRGYADLRDTMGCFNFSRSMLLREGRLEILMYAS